MKNIVLISDTKINIFSAGMAFDFKKVNNLQFVKTQNLLKHKSVVGVPVGGILMNGRGYKCVANHVLKEMLPGFYPPPMGKNCVFANQESAIIAEKIMKILTQSKK